jgi:Ion transport protein
VLVFSTDTSENRRRLAACTVLQLPDWLKLSITNGNEFKNKIHLNVTAAGLILQNIQDALIDCAKIPTNEVDITDNDLHDWKAQDIKQYLRYVNDWCSSDAIHELIELFSSFPREATSFMQDTRHLAFSQQFTLNVALDTPHAAHDEWVQCMNNNTITAAEAAKQWTDDSKNKIFVVEQGNVLAIGLGCVYNGVSNLFAHLMLLWHWLTRGGTDKHKSYIQQIKMYTDKRVDVTAHKVRLHGVAGIRTLIMAVDAADTMNSSEIFKSEVITAVVVLHWRMYANRSHQYSLLGYVILLGLFVYMTITVETASTSKGRAMQAGKIVIGVCFLLREFKEATTGCFKWISDMWNLMDLAAYGLMIYATFLQLFELKPQTVMGMNAFAAVLLWFKLLHYMRPYRSTGPLVAMIFEIVRAMRAFMLVLTIVLIGFANAFYTILRTKTYHDTPHEESEGSYSTVYLSLRSVIMYVFAGYNLDELDKGPLKTQLSILLVVFVVIVSVVLLNVLIGIIVNKFERLNAEPLHHWRHEQAKIILARHARLFKCQQERLEEYLNDKPYLHILRPTNSLIGNANEGSERKAE